MLVLDLVDVCQRCGRDGWRGLWHRRWCGRQGICRRRGLGFNSRSWVGPRRMSRQGPVTSSVDVVPMALEACMSREQAIACVRQRASVHAEVGASARPTPWPDCLSGLVPATFERSKAKNAMQSYAIAEKNRIPYLHHSIMSYRYHNCAGLCLLSPLGGDRSRRRGTRRSFLRGC